MAQRKSTRPRRPAKKPMPEQKFSLFQKKQPEFRPDKQRTDWAGKLHITQLQRDSLLKWGSYVLLLILLLVVQDVIMSKVSIFGTTTDLLACAILLITVMEGIETGSLFVLIATLLFYFSGSAPGPYTVALLPVLGIVTCIFRQRFWHRNLSSIVLCAGIALMVYELAVFGIGIFTGMTYWGRFFVFLGCGLISWAVMLPLYPLIHAIGQIGGNTWKE